MVEALLPAFKVEINWLDDTYRIERLYVDHQGADRVIRIVVGLAHCVMLEDRPFCGHPKALANASTLLGNVTLPAILLVAPVLAWPARRWQEHGMRLVALLPALTMLWALDVPFVLWAALFSLHVDAFAPDLFSPLLVWSQFLQGGGRLALAFVLGAAALTVARALAERVGGSIKA